MVQNFKGDLTELKMQDVANPLLDLTDAALDDFYVNGFDCSAFLLMLYDQKRMPFSDRINRDAFVSFLKGALINFPFTGSFESYLFVLRSVFGADSDIEFTIPTPGKLEINVLAIAQAEFDFIGDEFVDGAFEFFNVADSDNNPFIFTGVPGIDTEYQLYLLFSEIMPAGIVPNISLDFFSRYDFIVDDGGADVWDLTDNLGNQIIFIEIGG